MIDRFTASRERMAMDLGNARLLRGKRLIALVHDQYYFNDEKCLGDVGPLTWDVGINDRISMYLLSDGESLGADLEDWETPPSFDIDATSVCSWRRESLLASSGFPALAGITITEVQGLLDKGWDQQVRLVAFKVSFETGDYLIYLNQGDDGVLLINEQPRCLMGRETTLVTSL